MGGSKTLVLAIDGGGIRGIVAAYIVARLEFALKKPCYQLFDIIGGTSTGGIISAALTTPNKISSPQNDVPFTGNDIVDIYQSDGSRIFVPQPEIDILSADYYGDDEAGNGIEPFLKTTIGPTLSLSDAHRIVSDLPAARVKQMFTTGYIVNSSGGNVVQNPVEYVDYGPYLFNWQDAISNKEDDYYVWEATRATSAAPTYFPIAQVGGNINGRSLALEKWIVDGGTMSNNPAVWGMTEAFRLNPRLSMQDLVIISIGTGVYPGENGVGIHNNSGITPDRGNWGKTPWMVEKMYDLQGNRADATILNVILSAVPQVADAQLAALAGLNNGGRGSGLTYIRLEPQILDVNAKMDDISPQNIQALISDAQSYIRTGQGYAAFQRAVAALS